MDNQSKLIDLINNKIPLVAMLAPSFPIVYEYPQIISRLKQLSFNYVVAVSAGAKTTNEELILALHNNPTSRFITSPCPSFVRLVRKKHPQFIQYLALKVDSPMVATTRIVKEKYPYCQPVFIGPCLVKKEEASEDYPELNILVLTYKELDEVFKHFNIPETTDTTQIFDIDEPSTRIYPTDGGLTFTSRVKNILKEDEIKIISGWKNIDAALSEFENNTKIRLLDVLFCEGGCINGPGIESQLTLEERKNKILQFSQKT